MRLDDGAVRGDGPHLDAHDPPGLQALEEPVGHAGLAPAVHAHANGVPVPGSRRKPPAFAAMSGRMEDGVGHLGIGHAHVAPLPGQNPGDPGVLRGAGVHARHWRRIVEMPSIMV